ncbi:hypothetical protein [Sulfurimonas sp.]|uniref:hypothetical protein n=1 Tax=Sulfurimonas sp. TaxID=2022749 RepID=UPI0025E5F60C|nr:hypothetical protein [Sulfurimonas sp.]
MSLKSLLLYSLLFSYSSLFAVTLTSNSSSETSKMNYKKNSYANYNAVLTAVKNTYGSDINDYYSKSSCSNTFNTTDDFSFLTYSSSNHKADVSINYWSETDSNGYYTFSLIIDSTKSCTYIDNCIDGEIFNTTSNMCEEEIIVPECTDNQTLNVDDNICECSFGFAMGDSACEVDTDKDGKPNSIDDDIDGDGILNEDDPDIDGDGIANELDDDIDGDGVANNSNSGSTCEGISEQKYFFPNSPTFSYSDYIYKAYYQTIDGCKSLVGDEVDSIFYNNDLNLNCERSYCFAHYTKEQECTFSSADRKPSGYVYLTDLNEDECTSKVGMSPIN